jgi:glutaredoxin
MNPQLTRLVVATFLLAPALSAHGLYKVVQPDGSVTYTDRPPATGNGRVITLGRPAAIVAPDVVLPLDLRQAAQRYPVTLYTSPDCAPCDNGRRFLQQRGVPYSERVVTTEEDASALERTVGGRTVPALTIGSQPLRGLSETDWSAYLDAAGYPRESRMPPNWQPPTPTPLVARMPARPQTTERSPPVESAVPVVPAVEAPPPPGALRF